MGYVEETYDYYTQKSSRDFPDVIDYYDREFTECVVKVVEPIKGELIKGETFSFYKTGGITKDREYFYLDPGDLIPEVGKYYIFTGKAHPDGTVTGGGTNGTIELEAGITAENIGNSEIYKAYTYAYENQILPSDIDPFTGEMTVSELVRYFAKADKNYGDGTPNALIYAKENEKRNYVDERYDKALKTENKKIK